MNARHSFDHAWQIKAAGPPMRRSVAIHPWCSGQPAGWNAFLSQTLYLDRCSEVTDILNGAHILICEDEPFIAYDLATAVEQAGGNVMGPVASVREAMDLLEQKSAHGAILDVNLSDGQVTPVAEELLKRGVPIVIHTGTGLPVTLAQHDMAYRLFFKPVRPELLIRCLADQFSAVKASGSGVP